jgi:two-component system cell cycle response regulator DivK
MRAEEFERGTLYVDPTKALAQKIRREPGQRQEPLCPRLVRDDPGDRPQRERRRIVNSILTDLNNCPNPYPCASPYAKAAGRRCRVPLGTGATGGHMKKRILVVEDNDLNRKLFCDVLIANGFTVEPVAEGAQAIERARQFVPNLVIMDIQLQDVSGLDLIASLKRDANLRSIPVLAVTAYAGKGDEERIRDVGAEGYLSKPVSIGPFMSTVKDLLLAA